MSAATALRPACEHVCLLGESPLWHPLEQCLYWVDIAARQVLRLRPGQSSPDCWPQASEPGCIAALHGGGLLVARRDGLWRLDTDSGETTLVSPPPYDPAQQRFNDGKVDPRGRLWLGTISDARRPEAALFAWNGSRFVCHAQGVTTSNGLAWSPDGGTMYWADTKAHEIYAFDVDPTAGALTHRRMFARFAPRASDQTLATYAGRPDGAAVDAEGCYWVAMYEGHAVLRIAPPGEVLARLAVPVACPTMVCFGGADLCTLYITTASDKRPASELAEEPWAGLVLQTRVSTPGLPATLAAA